MAVLTSMGKLGQKILADATHNNPHHRNRVRVKGYRTHVQGVLSALNSESPRNATWECGVNLIHYTIHEDLVYLILCEPSLSDTEAFERLADLIKFKTYFSQNNDNLNDKEMRRKFVLKNKNTHQQMFDNFYAQTTAIPAAAGKVIKTPEFISSEDDSDNDNDSKMKMKQPRANLTQPAYRFLCSECGFGTMKKSTFVKHSKTNCTEKKATLKCPENECEWYSVTLADLDTHISTIHGREFEVETKEFKGMSELEEFLTEIQRTLHSSYVRRRGQQGKLIIMTCSRSGQTPNKHKSTGTGKRRIRAGAGSNKSDKICTSRIILKILESGRLRATFHKTHSGHTIEPRKIFIAMRDKIRIAQMLRDGMTKQEVIDKIKAENCNEMNRLSLINRKDVDNIVTQFKLDRHRVKLKGDGTPGHSTRTKNKKPKVRLGFEGNDLGQGQESQNELIYDNVNVTEIEQEFVYEEIEVPQPHPSENTVIVSGSDTDEISTLFSTAYNLIQNQNDEEILKNALVTAIALMKNRHSHTGLQQQLFY